MAQIDNHVERTWNVSHSEAHDNSTPSKIIFGDLKNAFLAKEWYSFHLSMKKLDYLHLKDFPHTNVNCTWSNHWHHHNARSLLLTTPCIIDLPLEMDGGQLSLSLERFDYATFSVMLQVNMRHTLWWRFLFVYSIREKFQSIYEIIVLGSLTSFSQLGNLQVNISLIMFKYNMIKC